MTGGSSLFKNYIANNLDKNNSVINMFWFRFSCLGFLILVVISLFFFPFFAVVVVDIAVLAHPCRIEFIMWAIPWFFVTTVFMVAVVAHSFRIMGFILMTTFIDLFPIPYHIKLRLLSPCLLPLAVLAIFSLLRLCWHLSGQLLAWV